MYIHIYVYTVYTQSIRREYIYTHSKCRAPSLLLCVLIGAALELSLSPLILFGPYPDGTYLGPTLAYWIYTPLKREKSELTGQERKRERERRRCRRRRRRPNWLYSTHSPIGHYYYILYTHNLFYYVSFCCFYVIPLLFFLLYFFPWAHHQFTLGMQCRLREYTHRAQHSSCTHTRRRTRKTKRDRREM